jgi:hypothetical protein
VDRTPVTSDTPVVAAAEGADYTPAVSDHTERIDGLVERVSAAKEFL